MSLTANQIQTILRGFHSEECDMIPDESVEDFSDKISSGQTADPEGFKGGGYEIATIATLAVVAAAANTIGLCISTFNDLKASLQRNPTFKEYAKELAVKSPQMVESSLKLAAAIYGVMTIQP